MLQCASLTPARRLLFFEMAWMAGKGAMAAPAVNREHSRETKRVRMTDFIVTLKGWADICGSNGNG